MPSHDRLMRAVQSAAKRLASSEQFDLLLKDVLAICVEAVGATGGTIYLHDPATKTLRFRHVLPEGVELKLPERIPDDYGLAGEAFTTRQTVQRELPVKPEEELTTMERSSGVPVHSAIAAPLLMERETPIGVVQLLNKREGAFDEADAAVLDIVSTVATMAYTNSRLTEESVRASSLLGMGKVSHDIGNLAAALYAHLNFGDVALQGLRERIQNAPRNAMTMTYLQSLEGTLGDLRESLDRIVGYSRLISDLAAGRELRPNLQSAGLAETIHTSAQYLEPEARANQVRILYDIQSDAPPTMHDEQYIVRIVQNLVGNAVKAVGEVVLGEGDKPGEVWVRYHFRDGVHTIEVSDTGPGMSPDTAERILSGNARSQWQQASGSGWGTKIVLELAATHGGEVSIESEVGRGSTFRVALPHRSE